MKTIVNGLEIGWDGISVDEMQDQQRLAALPQVPLGRSQDVRRDKSYGRLVPLYKVHDGRVCSYRFSLWLCRCTCWKGKLTVVVGSTLRKYERQGKNQGCGCVHSEQSSAQLAMQRQNPDFQRRLAAGGGAFLRRYHRENPEAVIAQSRANGKRLQSNPAWRAAEEERVRQRRVSRNRHPDIPIATHYTRIRHALVPLTSHILRVRDDYTCALCKVRGKVRFAVHHIVPVEVEWVRVGDPCNLVTLCFKCHFRDAHGGRWNTVDADLQVALQRLAADSERSRETPKEIIGMVAERLAVLGRELGRA